jgi:hypothetical protein
MNKPYIGGYAVAIRYEITGESADATFPLADDAII